MKSLLSLALAGAFLCMPLSTTPAAQIMCSGVLGNSGEQGASLVRFGAVPARGLGVVSDETGSLWDRGGDGVLNRYALDGRLLAAYKIPLGHGDNDRITRVGKLLLLELSGKLYTLPLDAAPNTAATPLGIQADIMSFGTVDNSVAIATTKDRKAWTVSLFDVVTKRVTPLVDGTLTGLYQIELTPDGKLLVQIADKLHLFSNGKEVTEGWPRSGPGDRLQWLDGYWYGSAWHGTIRRFDRELEPDPGVVLGGGSGSFIGHVDGNPELELSRSLAKINDGLFASSGMYGILHLLHWDGDRQQFAIVRRIGAIPVCQGLGINKQGQVWFNFGYWNWNDGPGGFLHDCTSGGPSHETPGIGQLVMLPNDNFVAPEIRNAQTEIIGGPFSWNVNVSDLKGGPANVGFLNGSAVYLDNKILTLLTINASGQGKSYRIDNNGKMIAELGPVNLEPQDQVKEWTSLVLKNNDTLLGAGDGFVIEMKRDGVNWKETRRWNSWEGSKPASFGEKIYIAADAGNLWVSDTKNHRVLCFAMSDNSVRATFGTAGEPGDDLAHLNEPCTLAAREARAVVFDSKNQRLIKLTLSE